MRIRPYFIFLFPILGLLISCAQIVTPSGGPKDDIPPLILNMDPEPFTTQFIENSFEIEFDEYIKLHEPSTQILISPPQRKNPEYVIKGKHLIVKFQDSLMENTTYTINFGQAIRDNNEGNVLGRLTYVFSTGSYIDSMQVSGTITDAFDGIPAKDVLVMLYEEDVDSLPLDTLPLYFARTDERGVFSVNHIMDKPYKIFALKDENSNYKYDLLEERIAFSDTMVLPHLPPVADDTTAISDSTAIETDTLTNDIEVTEIGDSEEQDDDKKPHLNMLMFAENDSVQYLKKTISDQFGKLQFVYNLPVGKLRVRPLKETLSSNWRIKEYSEERDTATLWLCNVESDSLTLLLQADQNKIDTVSLKVARPDTAEPDKPKKKIGKGTGTSRSLAIKASVVRPGRSPKPSEPIQIRTDRPVSSIEMSNLILTEDSIPVKFRLEVSDSVFRKYNLVYQRTSGKDYELTILPNAFTDFNGQGNKDTTKSSFVAVDTEELGSMMLEVKPPVNKTTIVELRNASGLLIHAQSFSQNGIMELSDLWPGKYKLQVVFDSNNNGKWDTGNYSSQIQPEKAMYHSSEIDIRANWDLELEWDLTDH